MRGMSPVTFTWGHLFGDWQWGPFSLLVLAGLLALAYWYLRGDWLLAGRGRRWPRRRTASFLGGLAAIDLALQSPIATLTGRYFQAHVVQHLLLMIVAPPLLALGAPSTLLLQTTSAGPRCAGWPCFGRRPSPCSRILFRSGPCTSAAMFVFFLTSLINVAMTHMALMDVINLVFLLGGCFYWWPMVGIDPIVHWKMGYGARMANVLIGRRARKPPRPRHPGTTESDRLDVHDTRARTPAGACSGRGPSSPPWSALCRSSSSGCAQEEARGSPGEGSAPGQGDGRGWSYRAAVDAVGGGVVGADRVVPVRSNRRRAPLGVRLMST